jgi:hypothetical protein
MQGLLVATNEFRPVDLEEFVREEFGEHQNCYGHCTQPATLRILDRDEMLIVGVVCHAGYASKIIAYGDKLDESRFKAFLTRALGTSPAVADDEIRTATRFPWEASSDGVNSMKVAYWTQNYRASKSDDPNRVGLFICQNCNSPYLQPANNRNVLCAGCQSG